MNRGIVVANPTRIVDESSGSGPYGVVAFHPTYLRNYILYWDEIHWVTISPFNVGMTPDLATLQDENILKPWIVPIYPSSGTYLAQAVATSDAQLSVLYDLNRDGKGIYVLGQAGPNLFLPDTDSQISPGIELKIINGLPFFTADVPIQEILNFKEKRKDELKHFQNTLSEFGLQISGTDNVVRAVNIGLEKIQLRMSDLHRVMNERYKGKFILTSSKTVFNMAMLIPEIVNALNGNPVEVIPLLAGATTIALSIGDILTLRNIPGYFSDVAYLYWIEKIPSDTKRLRRHPPK